MNHGIAYKNYLLLIVLFFQKTYAEERENPYHYTTYYTEKEDENTITKAPTRIMKDWTFLVYIAADNDLNYFSGKNLDDMSKIGSTDYVNIIAHLDRQGAYEKTKRLYIEKGRIIQVNYGQPSAAQKLDSGSAETLIDFCQWAIQNYPAKHYALILWNHGSGILDSVGGRTVINPSELFIFNPQTNMLEIDRSVGFLDFVQDKSQFDPRAVCFSETYNSFLSNQKLDFALKTIQKTALNGGKFDIIGYDACLMGMVEIASLLKPYSNFAVFSQEIELGSGWKYDEVLRPFLSKTLSPAEFAKQIVAAYKVAYQSITYDFTFSAVDLNAIALLEKYINDFSVAVLEGLRSQQNNSFSNTLKACRSKRLCTHFSEPSYIDLDHFLGNIVENIDYVTFIPEKTQTLKTTIKALGTAARNQLALSVISHAEGKNLARARGLSIYSPTRQIDPTYLITPFGRTNKWVSLIDLVF